ncbi:MAG: metalloprotease-like protein [Actinophytocola sp.]|uniref:neutral zinc metallopeptidase n=1 Tax=Actinophytocola sp. TaxID=1872138 RepID=UPI0013225D2C|nr:neutral zinc metallopeptidase [Actinophytocola sp.]MPZ85630.1 metalloprotease-like protein [Actinophytocola sp.]
MRTRTGVPAVLLLFVTVSLTACTTAIAGSPTSSGSVVTHTDPGQPGGIDPSFVKNTDGGEIDRLAAAVLTDVQSYWSETFPKTFGGDWAELRGGFYSVDTSRTDAPKPPCVDKASDVEGNAFYCPTADIIAWDRAALLPVLKERFGEAAVMLVLAHEMGHAVQRQAGLTVEEQQSDPDKYPTILIEAQADCYAGSFVRWVADDNATYLQIAEDRLDSALESLITFRDPIGTEQSDEGAHGDAFDRVSAFQDGFDSGASLCSEMSVDNRVFTQQGFINAADAETGGNLDFNQMLESITPNLNTYFGGLVTERGAQWREPSLTPTEERPNCTDADQGPVAFCPDGTKIDFDTQDELPEIHTQIGDYATGTLLASRYAVAALTDLKKPTEGADSQHDLVCLAGSFTGSLLNREQRYLSPGDLDEAIQVLLTYDYAARDIKGKGIPTGFERVRAFRKGVVDGAKACGLD